MRFVRTIRVHRSFLLVTLLPLAALPALSQTIQTKGTPPFGTFGGGPDIINLANLNSHVTVPLFHKPGRGLSFDFSLVYDSSI